ncbi:type II toxin-antitoxin system RelE/ParE family toxin [Pseudomonas gingeri NCPPB 3146 = LMG 5327]|uniref:Type II toxin-antitoxin system RelE/ParE family toxin n=2 Tax=Pseudomonas gingeri TaxID=117681 RepID=A0A7Y7XWQ0_9PSED|nr:MULTISPECIES: type II toxin-antitoxin system RelE/ParE family toxin [Pseudomonas]NVZ28479.1 type II toxin-antitoxin system RelE/ParE family toxin [Pseudomonas gingeri]NWC12487.1 type II toxin-antitoxin system RelE/ParE family toxin [Pseudomonas gingeri]NWE67770.1 type II toxin-antitoxin system RelE/ParE family toxin [Pseudomonas gingeri]PNQ93374.1 type II toxin-antitoxin system RelE/ParE family toxin [Pseudomonas gingeri NCPPB 3146 = LMG 5327]
MPRMIFAPAAIRDIQRLREFLRPKNADAAKRAGEAIIQGVRLLAAQPQIGRLVDDLPDEYREWLIDFGDSGYVARYRIDLDTVTILTVRHQKEAGSA